MPGGSLFDELAGLIDPTPEEATDEPQGIVVGHIKDDGTYEYRPDEEIVAEAYAESLKRSQELAKSIWSLKGMGFRIVYEGDDDIGEILGLHRPGYYQVNGVWNLG